MPAAADLPVFVFLCVSLGLLSGLLAGLLGIGGGIVLVPGLTLIIGRASGFSHDTGVKIAIGTSLAIIGFTAIASMRAHHRRGAVRWDWVAWLAPGIMVGSIAAAQVAHRLPSDLLVLAFCGFVLFSAQRLWRGSAAGSAKATGAPPEETVPVSRAGLLPRLFGGFAIGSAGALVGAGGAFISVPLLRRQRVPIHAAIGSSAALGLPVAVTGALAYAATGMKDPLLAGHSALVGYVHLPALGATAVGAMLAAPWGARLAHALDRRRLERSFSLLLAVLAGWMLWRTLSH